MSKESVLLDIDRTVVEVDGPMRTVLDRDGIRYTEGDFDLGLLHSKDPVLVDYAKRLLARPGFVRSLPPLLDAPEAIQLLAGDFFVHMATGRESSVIKATGEAFDEYGVSPFVESVNFCPDGENVGDFKLDLKPKISPRVAAVFEDDPDIALRYARQADEELNNGGIYGFKIYWIGNPEKLLSYREFLRVMNNKYITVAPSLYVAASDLVGVKTWERADHSFII